MTKTKRKAKTLAHVKKLSQLLAIGLRDLRKQERAKDSEVDMGIWLRRNGTCVACIAGSVMRFSLGIRKHGETDPYDLPDYKLMSALNCLRGGDVEEAAKRLKVKTKLEYRPICGYDGPNGEWWREMKSLLKDLKAAGE